MPRRRSSDSCAPWSTAARRTMRISRSPTPTITQSRQARRISERLEIVSSVASDSAARCMLPLLDRGYGLAEAVEPRFVVASEVVDPGLLEDLDGSMVLAGLARGRQLPHDGGHPGRGVLRAVPRLLDLVLQVGDRAEAVQQSPVHQPGVALCPLMIAVLGRGHAEREHGADDHDHGGREMPAHPGAPVTCRHKGSRRRAKAGTAGGHALRESTSFGASPALRRASSRWVRSVEGLSLAGSGDEPCNRAPSKRGDG